MSKTYRIALGGPGKTVHVASFDAGACSLSTSSSLEAPRATWLLAHPSAPGIFFSTGEQDGGVVHVLTADSHKVLASVRSGGQNPTHLALSPDVSELLVAHYAAGGVGVLRVLPGAPYLELGPVQMVDDFVWTAPAPHERGKIVPDRQERSHPHQVLPIGDGEVLVPDLGADKVWRLARGPGVEGTWEVAGALDFPRGSGPRHALLHDGVLYTVAELSNELVAHAWPAGDLLGTLSTLPHPSPAPTNASSPPLLPGEILYADANAAPPVDAPRAHLKADPQLAAEILVDGEGYIYVTNRNEPGAQGDSIVVYSPHPDFKVVRRYYPGVRHLRGIAFSPDGKYVAFAGMNGGGVRVWERAGKGELKDTGARADVGASRACCGCERERNGLVERNEAEPLYHLAACPRAPVARRARPAPRTKEIQCVLCLLRAPQSAPTTGRDHARMPSCRCPRPAPQMARSSHSPRLYAPQAGRDCRTRSAPRLGVLSFFLAHLLGEIAA